MVIEAKALPVTIANNAWKSPLLFEPFLLTGRMEITNWSPCPSLPRVTLDMLQVTSSSTTTVHIE